MMKVSQRTSTASLQRSIWQEGMNLKSIVYLQREVVLDEFLNIINFENKQETLFQTTNIRMRQALDKFNICNIRNAAKITQWNKNNFMERAMSYINELENVEIKKPGLQKSANRLLGDIEINNSNLGLIGKLIRNDIIGPKKLVQNGHLKNIEEINILLPKSSKLSKYQYKTLQKAYCEPESKKIKRRINPIY